ILPDERLERGRAQPALLELAAGERLERERERPLLQRADLRIIDLARAPRLLEHGDALLTAERAPQIGLREIRDVGVRDVHRIDPERRERAVWRRLLPRDLPEGQELHERESRLGSERAER